MALATVGTRIRTCMVDTYTTTFSRPPLVESSREDKVSALCSGFPMPSWYSATVPRRDFASDNQPYSHAVACGLLARRHWLFQLRDDGPWVTVRFRALNSLPSFVRDEQSLAAFRRQLKTVLFRTSFGEDANTWAASLLTRDCLVFVRWPCNVLCVIMPP